MPYNCLGDLYKGEVVARLRELGCNVKNVHALNLILEEMGLQTHSGNHWITTKEGVKYTIFHSRVVDAIAWHPSVVDVIYKYLSSKKD